MAEIIGVIGSVVGLLTAAEVAHSKMKGMKGLPEAFDAVARQVPLAQRILDAVESQTRNAPESTLRAILPVVHSCRENAETLKTTLEKLQPGDSASAWSLDHYVSLIKCRGKKGRVEDLMRQILRDILTLASYKTIHAATSEELAGLKAAIEEVGNVKASAPDTLLEDAKGVNISHGGQGPMLNQVGDYTTSWNHFGSGHINHVQGDAHFGATQDERKRQALRRLNPSSYESHKDRNPPAAVNTCRWFVEHQNFRDWLSEQSSSLLWVSADPGCGKSVLARHLIENVLPTSTPSSRVIYFFFKDDFADQRSAESALRGLLHQLLSGDSPLFTKALLESFEDLGEKMFEGFSNLWRLFLNTISQPNAGEIICVLGALDECHVGWDRLIKSLGELCGNPTSGFKPILLSRPYSNIESDFRSLQGKVKFIRVRGEDDSELTNIESEIEIVIRSKVDGLKKELGLTQEAEELLFQQLCQTQNRTYLWVHLVCDMLRTVENVSISDSIQQIPKTVEEAYNKILNQGRDHDKARVLLHIVVAAYKPLSLDEMATALAIQSHKSLEMPELQVATAEDCRKIIRNVATTSYMAFHHWSGSPVYSRTIRMEF
ncbi:hypothetical protein CkaCkLH20_02910 [Colletotrichum karsti]|uniref:Vegetative incompatibility protein HET-E-1 n=1 Tax=Colletotrichum karsti TaxID=1095194 RepID=A0A9P6IBL6_9PEZI|nr:uncharacterized protein CkaCkLH20_02910 [Colletotrichum karsti]KAF9879367.1 hypothetical protein CkaCkLH20_02910 [Colletotrichum karsti]